MLAINNIYNMDCVDGLKLLDDKSVDMVLTDVPYNSCSGLEEGGLRKINKDGADEVEFDFDEVIDTLCKKAKGSIYVFCGNQQISRIFDTMKKNGMTTRICCWEKTNPSPMNGQYMWLSNIECCVYGRYPKATFNEFCQSSVWRSVCGTSEIHPTQKPVELFKRLILASSNKGDVVLDPFSGSGTTAVACKNTGRQFIAFEKNPKFFQASIKRYNEDTMQQDLFI